MRTRPLHGPVNRLRYQTERWSAPRFTRITPSPTESKSRKQRDRRPQRLRFYKSRPRHRLLFNLKKSPNSGPFWSGSRMRLPGLHHTFKSSPPWFPRNNKSSFISVKSWKPVHFRRRRPARRPPLSGETVSVGRNPLTTRRRISLRKTSIRFLIRKAKVRRSICKLPRFGQCRPLALGSPLKRFAGKEEQIY